MLRDAALYRRCAWMVVVADNDVLDDPHTSPTSQTFTIVDKLWVDYLLKLEKHIGSRPQDGDGKLRACFACGIECSHRC